MELDWGHCACVDVDLPAVWGNPVYTAVPTVFKAGHVMIRDQYIRNTITSVCPCVCKCKKKFTS